MAERAATTAARTARRPRPPVTVSNEAMRGVQRRIALLTIAIPFAGTLLAVGLGVVHGIGALELSFAAVGFVVGQLALEVGFHRGLAHKAFDTSRAMRLLFAVLGSMTAEGRVVHWVANHRRHHIHSDTDDDPHSPHVRRVRGRAEALGRWRGLWHAHVGHMLTDDMPNCTLFARDINADPLMRAANEWYATIVALGLALPAGLGLAITGTWMGALQGLLWGGFVRMFLTHHVTWSVASFSHRFGSVMFETGDHSANLVWAALPSFGSGWQNNHHAFPDSAETGLGRGQLDGGGLVIRGLERLGLVWNVRRPTREQIEAQRLERDGRAARGGESR